MRYYIYFEDDWGTVEVGFDAEPESMGQKAKEKMAAVMAEMYEGKHHVQEYTVEDGDGKVFITRMIDYSPHVTIDCMCGNCGWCKDVRMRGLEKSGFCQNIDAEAAVHIMSVYAATD